jgi:hypothetical protein
MRASLAVVALALAGPAHADRHNSVATVELAAIGDARATGPTWGATAERDVAPWGGSRLTLSFEDAPLAVPPPGLSAHDTRLVPELFAGFLANDIKAEGMLGAGVRGELALASHRRSSPVRIVMYVAARADVIGKHRDGAGEAAIGEYILLGDGSTRFGWEGGAMMRPRPHAVASRSHELDALMSIYLGWAL